MTRLDDVVRDLGCKFRGAESSSLTSSLSFLKQLW